MATKSIADQILSNLQKEREVKVKSNKTICLKFMQKFFDDELNDFEKIESNHSYVFWDTNLIPLPLEKNIFISTCESLGFKIEVINNVELAFIVPKHKKGKKWTPAQEMLYIHTLEFYKKKKEAENFVKTEKEHIWNLLKTGEFGSKDNNDGTFTISIALKEERFQAIFDEKLLKFLSQRAFPNAEISENTLLITLGEKTEENPE